MIWDVEVIKADGNLYAYIRVQNEFTGNISGSFRRIYKDKNGYYAKADGKNNYMTNEVESYLKRASLEREAILFWKEYKNKIGGYR